MTADPTKLSNATLRGNITRLKKKLQVYEIELAKRTLDEVVEQTLLDPNLDKPARKKKNVVKD